MNILENDIKNPVRSLSCYIADYEGLLICLNNPFSWSVKQIYVSQLSSISGENEYSEFMNMI